MFCRTVVNAARRPGRPALPLFRFAAVGFAVLIFLAVPMLVRAACPDFAPPVNYGVAYTPASVAAGDFNGDGRPDLAVANGSSGNVSVLLANGPGTFANAVNYTTGASPTSVLAADFDRDGKLDLAVTVLSGNNVAFLKGNGNGTFQTATTTGVHTGPVFLITADFDGDGRLDLAVANNGSNDISILKGNGSGGFAAAVNFNVGSSPQWIAINDFNRDGKLDLVVADFTANDVALLLGNGLGSFGTATYFNIPGSAQSLLSRPTSITSSDFNGDGKADIAVANATALTVAVLLGNGSGGFGTATSFDVGVEPRAMIRGDFNGDGKDDLAVAQYDYDPNYNAIISVLVGNGSGGFTSGGNITLSPPGTAPAALAAADFNSDGKIDLASANRGTFDVSILLNGGACYVNCSTFASATNHATTSSPDSIAFGDFNRDGNLDFAGASPAIDKVVVFLATGPGTFSSSSSFDAGTSPHSVVAADFNRDGILDLAVANGTTGNVSVLLGTAVGGFSSAASYAAGTSPVAIAVGDFNRDGKLDLATADEGAGNAAILLGNGSGAFSLGGSYGTGALPKSVVVGDFDGDGVSDLAVANQVSQTVSILHGGGDGTFSSAGNLPNAGTSPVFVAAGDFNRDGLLDLAVADSGSNDVSIFIGGAAGSFANAVTYGVGSAASSLAIADFNRDGRLDVAVSHSSSTDLSILPGNGNGTFASAASVSAASALSIAAADIDGDGKPDLAIADSGSANVGILLNTCPAPDLTVVKSHSGTFAQGQNSRLYSIVVSNIASTATAGTVTVTDTLPEGLTAVVLDGAGWTCTLATLTCTRSDSLAGNSSYTTITLAVDVSLNAPAIVTNIATVSGGGQVNNANDTSSDPANVTGYQDVTVVKTHAGIFFQGQTGATYTLTVSNVGRAATAGTVAVLDTLPAGLTATAISGTSWTCTLAPLRCTRSDALAAGGTYPQVTVTVNVATDAAAVVTNTATVSGGGQLYTGNDSATDPTTINPPAQDLAIVKTHGGSFTQGQVGAAYTVTVSNAGSIATSGVVTVTDTLPAGLTATAIGGSGWSCTPATLTCTRSDGLAATGSYPPITVTVNVSSSAAASVTNTASVAAAAETNTLNDSAADPTTINASALIAPTNLIASAASISTVNVAWDAVTTAVGYQVFRKSGGAAFGLVTTVPSPSFPDSGLTPSTAYVYQVKAVNASSSVGPPSNADVATTIVFTDDPIEAGLTVIQAIHLTEMRTALNAVLIAAGLPIATFTDESPAGGLIKAVHITELRSNLDAARAALGLPSLVYTDVSLATGTAVKAAHVMEVRSGTK